MKVFNEEEMEECIIRNCDELKSTFAGFDLGAWRQSDGTYIDFDGKYKFNDFPKSIHIFGNTFQLEEIVEGRDTEKGQWVNAIYV